MNAVLDAPVSQAKTPPDEPLTRSAVIARGKEIYETTIKALVEPEHMGKFLSINVLSGEYQMHNTLSDVAVYQHSLPDVRENEIPPRFLMRVGSFSAFKKSGRRLRQRING